MKFKTWGNFPIINNFPVDFKKVRNLKKLISSNKEFIPFGNGRCYGDSALNKNIINVKSYNSFLNFDKKNGFIHIQAGVLLSEILEVTVPDGWFLKVTPGTKLITVGGAIASDIHGKNHHIEGCFSECVLEFNLMLPNGKVVLCSKNNNTELFKATCGGMGLTGVILDAIISLKKIKSKFINQTTIKTKSLKETFEMFEKYREVPYSVAWIDCLAKENQLGKCILMLGDFDKSCNLNYKPKRKINIPFFFPSFFLNNVTVRVFNFFYYNKMLRKISSKKVDFETFFYPLDSVHNWNRIYGKNGFTQYQFILPLETSYDGLKEILKTISMSGKGSFLAVLKLYGKSNDNYLSFPQEGYSLALDFKIQKGIFDLLDKLDKIVVKFGGRIYLSKDVRVSKEIFEIGYPLVDKFRKLRKKYKMNLKFNSLQSKRLDL